MVEIKDIPKTVKEYLMKIKWGGFREGLIKLGLNPEVMLSNLKAGKAPYQHKEPVEECLRKLKARVRIGIPGKQLGTSKSSKEPQEKEKTQAREEKKKGYRQEPQRTEVKKEECEEESGEGILEEADYECSPTDARQSLSDFKKVQKPPGTLNKEEIPKTIQEFRKFVLTRGAFERLIEINVNPSTLKKPLEREETQRTERDKGRLHELREKLRQTSLRGLSEKDNDLGGRKSENYARSSKPVQEEPTKKRIIARRSPEGPEPPWKRRNKGNWEKKKERQVRT